MPSSRPLSRNPFLDQPLAPRPADNLAAAGAAGAAGPDKTQSLTAEDIFVRFRLSLPLPHGRVCRRRLIPLRSQQSAGAN